MNSRFTALVFALGCLQSMTSAQTPAPLRTVIETEIRNQTFVTRIPIANAWKSYNSDHAAELTRLVDTEAIPGPEGIRYLVRAGSVERPLALLRNFHIRPDAITSMLPAGTSITVTDVRWFDDRLELWLSGPRGEYGKLKLMFGKGFQNRLSADQVLAFTGNQLVLPRLERRRALESAFESLRQRLAASDSAPGDATNLESKMSKLRHVEMLLAEMIDNRRAYADAVPGAPPATELIARRESVQRELEALRAEYNRSTAASLQRSIEAAAIESADVLNGLLDPKSSVDLEDRQTALARVELLIGDRERQLGELAAADSALNREAWLAGLAKDQALFEEAVKAVAAAARRQRISELDAELRTLEARQLRQLDAYTMAFGSASQPQRAGELRATLEALIRNREEAASAGAPAAAAAAERWRRERQRIR